MEKSVTKRIFDLLKTKKREVAVLVCFVIIATAFDIAVPFISQRLIDTLIQFFRSGEEGLSRC